MSFSLFNVGTFSCFLVLLLLLVPVFLFSKAIQGNPIVLGDTIGCAPLTVKLKSSVPDVSSYYWDLGNGNASVIAELTNIYAKPGKYNIKLKLKTKDGKVDSFFLYNKIIVTSSPVADFSADFTSICPESKINFSNSSVNATLWIWDFGDGTFSMEPQPGHYIILQDCIMYSLLL